MLGKKKAEKNPVREKKKIGIVGVGHSSGTSTIAQQLAFFLGKNNFRTSFFELTEKPNKGSSYYSLFFDKILEHDDLVDFYQGVKEGKKIHTMHNFWREINWAITLPKSRCLEPLAQLEKQHLLSNLLGQFVVCDVEFSKENWKVLEEFDLIFAVIDPLPSKIMENFETIRRLKELEFLGYEIAWVINKFNKGVHLHDLLKSLQLNDYHKVPMLSAQSIYDCQYRCKDTFLNKEERNLLENLFSLSLSKIDIYI